MSATIGSYLIDRLHGLGLRHVFGIPGDYVLAFFKLLEESPIRLVGTTNELAAGYAADAYARVNGIGGVCVTYAVGGFSLLNALAGAYAEKSPVVAISGSPGIRERKRNALLHHCVGGFETQMEVFRKVTVASAALDDPLTAFREIDRVLAACLRYKRPVYFEIPRDCVARPPLHPHSPIEEELQSDPHELAEAVAETAQMVRTARQPVILAGIEIARHGLQDELMRFAEVNRIPMASMLLSKSVVPETHPLYLGVYQAGMGRPEVTRYVEESDCVLMIGTLLTDIDTGIFTHHLHEGHSIAATTDSVRIRHHSYLYIQLADYLAGLGATKVTVGNPVRPPHPRPEPPPNDWQPQPDTPVTVKRLFQKINSLLDANTTVLADPGDALFAAADLTVHQRAEFLGASFYATLGWAVPAAVGAQTANPHRRPIVLVGDGAFQMTGTELGTTLRGGYNPIVVVLNNRGYLTERFLMEGAFNDIPNWEYHRLPEFLGGGRGFEVRTEADLESALTAAVANRDSFSVLNVLIRSDDYSPALHRLAGALAQRV